MHEISALPIEPQRVLVFGGTGTIGQAAVRALLRLGHTVVCVLPGHESEVEEFHCDRALVLQSGNWTLTTL